MDQGEDFDTDTEIDPQWFIKCRLCINEMGVYQILPSVQEQIFYCFQIQVKAFDSLPQLICKKCKLKLIEFYDVKKTFVDNQAKISSQLQSMKGKENQKEVASSKEDHENEIVEHKKEEKSQKILDSIKRNSCSTKAEQNFNKIYVCRYCGIKCKKHIEIIKHIISHKKLLTKSKKYISKHLVISLDKFDSKPNFTGHHKSVALGSDNVNLDEGSPHYFIKLEECKVIRNDTKPVKTPEKKTKRKQVFLDSDSSDSRSQLVFQSQAQKKRRRIISNGSSTDTIIIDDDAKSVQSEKSAEGLNNGIVNEESNDACINIDDSSSDTLYAGGVRNKDKQKSEEMAAIESIISMCYKKYTSNTVSQGNSVTKSDLDKMLNRKFLSIGRKILLGKSIPCQGLLKYLEHKNITINWSPANALMNSKNAQVRINTNVVDIKNSNNLEGWMAIKENEQLNNYVVDLPNPIKTFPRDDKPYESNFFDDTPLEEEANVCPIEDLNCATLMLQSFDTESTGNKLLNENPVANPKQLPKNLNRLLFDIKVKKNDVHVHNGAAIDLDPEEGNHSGLSMPVIVSSESLASAIIIDPHSRTKQEDTKENTNGSESTNSLNASLSPRPRLKCKPVSELMSNTTEHSSLLSAPIIKPVESGLRNATIIRLEHRSSSVTGNIKSSVYHTKNNNNFVYAQPVKSVPEGPGFKLIPPGQRETPVPKPPIVLWTNPTQDLPGKVLLHSKPLSMGSATGVKGSVPVTSESGPQAATSAVPTAATTSPADAPTAATTSPADAPTAATTSPADAPTAATTSPADAPAAPAAVAVAPTVISADNAASEVVMNSVQLPNMPVQNSIKYFQSVLLLHNLELMTGTESDITSEFTCLIKFKLEIRLQGRSVVLSVFVFAKTGCFCIKLKKPNLDEIDIDALPPHWQLHILNAFRGQVSEKIINCASKVSRALHGDAKLFVCLLNSIEYNK